MHEIDTAKQTKAIDPLTAEQAECERVLTKCELDFKKLLIKLNNQGVIVREEINIFDLDTQIFRFERKGIITGRKYFCRFELDRDLIELFSDNMPEVLIDGFVTERNGAQGDGEEVCGPCCESLQGPDVAICRTGENSPNTERIDGDLEGIHFAGIGEHENEHV
jgi:hypothetical protein